MRRILLSALLAFSLALPAAAQSYIQGVLVEPRHPTTSDRIRLTMVGVEPQICWAYKEPVYEIPTGTVVLGIELVDPCIATPIELPFRRTYEIGPLEAGQHYAEVRFLGVPGFAWRELFEVSEDPAQLDLGDEGQFQVRVNWSNPRDGSSGSGHARKLARDSGAFWFFSPDNLEVTVKVLDGRAVNGKWWVFIASMTDLRLEIEVSQLRGAAKTYVQAAGANRNFIDVEAFGEGPPVPEELLPRPAIAIEPERPVSTHPVRAEVSVFNAGPDVELLGMEGKSILFDYPETDGPPPPQHSTAEANVGPLAPGVYTVDVRSFGAHNFGRTFEVAAPLGHLTLRSTADNHFNVYVNIDSPPGGVGYGVPLSSESGYFWFFDPDNIELTVKILDGRPVNGKYWVFISSMTDVAFSFLVEHCPEFVTPPACNIRLYQGVQGVNRNFIDVNFPGL